MIKKLLVPNAAPLIESMRSIGYSFETAIADIIDNSIYAKASNIHIYYDVFGEEPYLLILDDGIGMSNLELSNAMIYGARNPMEKRDKRDLGRFGLGLKSASLSQCRELVVISKKEEVSSYSWDIDFVIENQEWAVKEYESKELGSLNFPKLNKLLSYETGTLVLWKNFDRIASKRTELQSEILKKVDILEQHLSLVFHRYLSGEEKINIFINDQAINPIDPFLESNKATQPKPTQDLEIRDSIVKVKPFILPHLNKLSNDELAMLGGKERLRSTQGYYIYRNKRLIIWGKWFGQYPKDELQKLVRIRVDIPNSLDYLWEIDVKKSQAVLPYEIKRNLAMFIHNALLDGKKVFHYRGRKKNENSKLEYVWDRIINKGLIRYNINLNHPIIKELIMKSNDESKTVSILRMIEDYLPIYQIYNDQASDKNILNNENNVQNIEKARLLLGLFDSDEALLILNNPRKYEGLNLSNEELDVLRKEYYNGCS